MKAINWFKDNLSIIIPVCFIIGFAFFMVYPMLPIPSGSVKGTFVSCEVHPMGDMCGDYAWTKVVLDNDVVYFDGEYYDVEKLTPGLCYEFVYKMGSRPSDTTSGDSISECYLLCINEG